MDCSPHARGTSRELQCEQSFTPSDFGADTILPYAVQSIAPPHPRKLVFDEEDPDPGLIPWGLPSLFVLL